MAPHLTIKQINNSTPTTSQLTCYGFYFLMLFYKSAPTLQSLCLIGPTSTFSTSINTHLLHLLLPFSPPFLSSPSCSLIHSWLISSCLASYINNVLRWRSSGSVPVTGSWNQVHRRWYPRMVIWSLPVKLRFFGGVNSGGLLRWWEEEEAHDIEPGVSPAVPLAKEEAIRRSHRGTEPVGSREPGAEERVEHCIKPVLPTMERERAVNIWVRCFADKTLQSLSDLRLHADAVTIVIQRST